MDHFTQKLVRLVGESRLSKTELARRTGIDRPTIYKFINGQRRPTEQQMDLLMQALCVTPAQETDLLRAYSFSDIPPNVMLRRTKVLDLLRSLSELQERLLNPVPPLPPLSAGFGGDQEVAYLDGTLSIQACLWSLLQEFLAAPDSAPLMLSARSDSNDRALLQSAFLAPAVPAKEIWQLFPLTKPGRDLSSDANLDYFAAAVAFLYQPSVNYAGRFCYHDASDLPIGSLLPQYYLFPAAALVLDVDGRRGMLLRQPETVALLREQYEYQFRSAQEFVALTPASMGISQALGHCLAPYRKEESLCWLRWEPPLSCFLDEQIVKASLPPDTPLPGVELLLRELAQAQALNPACYFTEAGVRDFVLSGCLRELPDLAYRPAPPPLRRELLTRLLRRCEAEGPEFLLLDSARLQLQPGTYLLVGAHTGVHFTRHNPMAAGPHTYRECFFPETSVTEAFWDFTASLRITGIARTREETLRILRDYLRVADGLCIEAERRG